MFESGTVVAEHVSPVTVAQIQPNGVDLTLDAVLTQVEPGRLAQEDTTIGERRPVDPIDAIENHEIEGDDSKKRAENATYQLPSGGYVVRYGEIVEIPPGYVGFVFPRSSLMRNACMLNTAVWDAGYRGRGEGLLQVHHEIELERGARIAQLVLARATHETTYDGSYQGENVE